MDKELEKKELQSVRVSAMNLLARREYSIVELRRKLRRKFVPCFNTNSLSNDSLASNRLGKNNLRKNVAIDYCSKKSLQSDGWKEQEQLQRNQWLEDAIERVIEQLLNEKLLDEARFTESFIQFRISKGSGPIKVRHELIDRGISTELINEYLDDTYDFWNEHIKAVRIKRFGAQYPENYKEQNKQFRFLYQRGFSSELISQFFNDFQE